MNRIIILIFIATFVIGSTIYCTAQNTPQPYFQNYSTEDGLPSPEIHCIFQDSKGYIWIGTDNGVARFDGYEFKKYSAKDGLTQNVVFGIQEDSKGRIWISTMNGEVFILDNDRLKPYRYNKKVLKFGTENHISKLKYIDREDTAYFELKGNGILIITKRGETEFHERIKDTNTNLLFEVDNKIMGCYLRPKKEPLDEYALILKRKGFDSVKVLDQSLTKWSQLKSMTPKPMGIILKSTNSKKYLFSHSSWFHCVIDGRFSWKVKTPYLLNAITQLRNGSIITCNTDGGGIQLYKDLIDVKEKKNQYILKNVSGNCILEDRKGGLWIGTNRQGIYYCSNFESEVYSKNFGFTDNHVSSIAFQSENILVIGDSQGRVYRIDTKNNIIIDELFIETIKGQYNYDLLFDKKSNILFTSNGYWQSGEFKPYYKKVTSGVYGFILKKILKHGSDFYGLEGLNVFTARNWPHNKIFESSKNIKIDLRPFSIYQDNFSQILVGREDGVFHFTDTSLTRLINDPFLHTRIEDINQLSNHTYILATKGKGIVLWKDTIQQIYTENDGLASDMIEKIHVVNDTIWVATLNGLSRIVQGAKKEIRTFDMSTGLPSNEIYDIESNNGQIWLATAKGLVKFQEVPENKFSLPPYLSNIQIGEQIFKSDTMATVNYQQNNIRIDYVTFNYKQKGRIPYRYRLQSNDKWIETKSTTALFTDLRPNDYMFEIQSQNEDGYWSESSVFTFCIKPAWYATWWFMGLSIVLVSGFIYWRFKRLAKQSAKELAFQKEKLMLMDQEVTMQAQIRDLERSALQAQMNPHFIFNCLNSIQNFIIENDQKNAVKYLSKFAHLTRQILNLSIDGKVNLVQEIQLLENYLSLEKLRFKNKFDYQIKIEPQISKEKIEIPPLLVQPFIENAIIHGMSSRTAGGRIDVDFTQSNEFLRISVFDNGLESVHHLKEIESKHKFKSVGMNITKKRLALLNEAEEKDMIQFEEIRNKNNDRVGTKVSIAIKI